MIWASIMAKAIADTMAKVTILPVVVTAHLLLSTAREVLPPKLETIHMNSIPTSTSLYGLKGNC